MSPSDEQQATLADYCPAHNRRYFFLPMYVMFTLVTMFSIGQMVMFWSHTSRFAHAGMSIKSELTCLSVKQCEEELEALEKRVTNLENRGE